MSIISPTNISYIKEKWQHAGFQKYLKNTGWMFFGRFFTLGISFLIGIYIARYLGPSNYGLLSYVTSFVGLFGFLASFGIDNIISREIIKNHDKKDELIGTAFYLKIIGSLVAILAVFIISILTTKDFFTLGLIWIFSLCFIPQAFNIIEIYFQSQVLSKKVVFAQITANIISALLKILVIIFGRGIFWLMVIFIIEASIYALILLFSFRKFGNHIRSWRFNFTIAKSLLRDSWPLMISTVAASLYFKIDQIMIKNMLGNEQAGIYAVAAKLSEVWYFIPIMICSSLFPAIINSKKTNEVLYQKRLSNLYSIMFWLSILIALPISILAKPIIAILFGQAYLGAVGTLSIYVWAGIGISWGTAVTYYLLAENYTGVFLLTTSVGAIINILLNIFLIPRIGIMGGAIATLISYTSAVFALVFYKKTRYQVILMLKSIKFQNL